MEERVEKRMSDKDIQGGKEDQEKIHWSESVPSPKRRIHLKHSTGLFSRESTGTPQRYCGFASRPQQ